MLQKKTAARHPEFDFDKARLILSESCSGDELEGEQITSPYDLFAVETLRDKRGIRRGRAVPVDVFVFGRGEPERRDGTKVGGLPYWPIDQPWPATPGGEQYKFLAQFCFTDSRDLVPSLPGDVLLLMVEDEQSWLWEPWRVHFEWQRLGHDSLIGAAELPQAQSDPAPAPFYGVVYRTHDYPDSGAFPDHAELDFEQVLSSLVGQSYNLPVLNGTKIGGVPHFIQGDDLSLQGRFLCQLGSIQAAPNVPYPWVNQPEPLGLEFDETGIYGEGNCVVFEDMGNVYIYMDDDAQLSCEIQSY